jgi:hypothetical protein
LLTGSAGSPVSGIEAPAGRVTQGRVGLIETVLGVLTSCVSVPLGSGISVFDTVSYMFKLE